MGTADVAKIAGVASNMETSSRVDTSQDAHHVTIEDANKNASANVLGNTQAHTPATTHIHTRARKHTDTRAQDTFLFLTRPQIHLDIGHFCLSLSLSL